MITGKPQGLITRRISLGFSPCPNDTFIFYALVHGKIDTRGVLFNESMNDIEELNQSALRGEPDVTKVSFHAAGCLLDDYCIIGSGAALGRGCGPLIVTREFLGIESLRGRRIAIPGRLTTASLLLGMYDPELTMNTVAMPFHRIMQSVRDAEVDGGLIIHEGRFTYPMYGLIEVLDLGKWWEGETGLPVPLGCIVARRSLGEGFLSDIEGMIRESVRYAYSHPEETVGYIKLYAQEMDDDVIRRHIELYVNEYSLDMGEDGRAAVQMLLTEACRKGLLPEIKGRIFCKKSRK